MTAPQMLAGSNTPAGDLVIRGIGFDASAEAEARATRDGQMDAYEFAHVVLGFKASVPRALASAPGLRSARVGAVQWVSGTVAAWWRAMLLEEVPARVRAGIAATLTRRTTLTPFGSALFMPEQPDWILWPTTPAELAPLSGADEATAAPALGVWGGIVGLTVDAVTERALVEAGARILRRGPATADAPWAAHAQPLTVDAVRADQAPVTVVGGLALPVPTLAAGDTRLVAAFEAAYRRMIAGLEDRSVADLLRLPIELAHVLVAVDLAALDAVRAQATHAQTRAAAAHAARLVRVAAGLAPDGTLSGTLSGPLSGTLSGPLPAGEPTPVAAHEGKGGKSAKGASAASAASAPAAPAEPVTLVEA